MFEYLGVCLPALRVLLTLVVAGNVLLAAGCFVRFWICEPAGQRSSLLLGRGVLILSSTFVALAVMALTLGDSGQSCPPIQETFSVP